MNRRAVFAVVAVVIVASVGLSSEPAKSFSDINLQRPATVTVSNWPLDESGNLKVAEKGQPNVAVTNFPAAQTVNGTVEVSNLPLDSNGAVPVTFAARPPVVYTFGPYVFNDNGQVMTDPIDTQGYNVVGVLHNVSPCADGGSPGPITQLEWEWSDSVGFVDLAADSRTGFPFQTYLDKINRAIFVPVQGQRLRLRISAACGVPVTVHSIAVQLRER